MSPSAGESVRGVRMVILGRQGAGKGTQALRLSERLGVPHISTGDMLRAAVREGTLLGRRAKQIMESGDLVPDDVMVGIVNDRLHRPDAEPGWILDGFPRTVGQAEALAAIATDRSVQVVIDLDVPNDVVVERISSRRMCVSCGTIYSVGDESAISGACAKCGGQVVQRDDDTESAIRRRLELYERETAPLVEHYRKVGLLVTVDGLGDPDEVSDRLAKAVASRADAG